MEVGFAALFCFARICSHPLSKKDPLFKSFYLETNILAYSPHLTGSNCGNATIAHLPCISHHRNPAGF